MITITDALIAEHRVLTDLFDHTETLLPKLTTLEEVRLLATLIERLLHGHAGAETDVAYAALDHVLEDKRELDHLHEDHHEIDRSLKRTQTATDLKEARRLLKAAIAASREHFQREEQNVFPLIERVLQSDTLVALGAARVQPRVALAG